MNMESSNGDPKAFTRVAGTETDLKVHPSAPEEEFKLHGLNHTCCFLNFYYNSEYNEVDFDFIVSDGRAGDVVRHRSSVKVWYVWFNCCHEEVIENQVSYFAPDTGAELDLHTQDESLFDITKFVSLRADKCKKRHDLPLVRTCSNRVVWAWCTPAGLLSTMTKICLCRNVVERRVVETLKCDSSYYMCKNRPAINEIQ